MGALTTAQQVTGLDADRWRGVGAGTLWSATAWVVVAASLLAANRLGGLATTEPRSFFRLGLVVVWGWLGMAVAAWAVLALAGGGRRGLRFRSTIAVVGAAHVPVLALAVTLFISAGALQLLWPCLVMAIFVVAFWFPASVFRGLRVSVGAPLAAALTATAVSYGVWLLVIGRHLLEQLGHLV